MAKASTNRRSKEPGDWDAVDAWHRLLRAHPVRVEAPGACTGRIEPRFLRDFLLGIAELPDPIQDTLFVLAHAQGCAYAIHALDTTLRAQLRTSSPARPAATGACAWHRRKAS